MEKVRAPKCLHTYTSGVNYSVGTTGGRAAYTVARFGGRRPREGDAVKQLAMVASGALVGFLAWLLASRLSSDALGMAVGLLFGMLAGVPTLLLMVASQKRQTRREDDDDTPVVHITYNTYTDNRQLTVNTSAPAMPLLADRQREIDAQRGGRVFKVVGEREEWSPREPLPPLPPGDRFEWWGTNSEWHDAE